MGLVRERAVFLADIPAKLGYLFREPEVPAAGEFIPKKGDVAAALELLRIGREFAAKAAGLDDGRAEELAKAIAEQKGVKLGDLLTPLRAAITGSRVSPPLFGSLRLLGAEKSLVRIDKALEVLTAEN
jgi:glutamyl-tRNA synthetase